MEGEISHFHSYETQGQGGEWVINPNQVVCGIVDKEKDVTIVAFQTTSTV